MSQPCAICGGPTERKNILPNDPSNYCPKCRVFTADSDGHEAERRQRINEIFWGIAQDIVRRRHAGEPVVNHHRLSPQSIAHSRNR